MCPVWKEKKKILKIMEGKFCCGFPFTTGLFTTKENSAIQIQSTTLQKI